MLYARAPSSGFTAAYTSLLLAPLFLFAAPGCSSASKHEKTVKNAIVRTIRVRRPQGRGADPKAGPGGEDYVSDPLPNETLDCEKPAALFRGFDLPKVRGCFTSIQKFTTPTGVFYDLRRGA